MPFPSDTDAVLAWYGRRVARRRAALGFSQRALAGHVGVHPSTMSRIEHGQMRGTRLAIIARIEWLLAPPSVRQGRGA